MIEVNKALELIERHSSVITTAREIRLKEALGFVLAEDAISTIDMPPFRQSAMDGYALHIGKDKSYRVIGEVKAGDSNYISLKAGEAVRIYTGAAVPETANAVIMQEKVRQNEGYISIEGIIVKNLNIRLQGEQIQVGDVALQKGITLNGAHLGFLANLGITSVNVHSKPSIAIVATGNELVPIGQPLSQGKIYESNSVMLKAVLNEIGYHNVSVASIKDDFRSTKEILQKTIQQHDVIIVTGGISVGDYDFVGKALKAIEVEEIFYKVKQKPGKPLFFGKKGHKSVFALPGNPAAALSCFYIYVHPLLKRCEGALVTELQRIQLPIATKYTVKGDRAQFLKARVSKNNVEILEGQSSAMLRAFGVANALVYLPEDTVQIKKGEMVTTILLHLT